jgi:hypothetical protein
MIKLVGRIGFWPRLMHKTNPESQVLDLIFHDVGTVGGVFLGLFSSYY